MTNSKTKKTKTKLKLINFKATPKEFAAIKKNAKVLTGGNISKWIRTVSADPRFHKTKRITIKRAA